MQTETQCVERPERRSRWAARHLVSRAIIPRVMAVELPYDLLVAAAFMHLFPLTGERAQVISVITIALVHLLKGAVVVGLLARAIRPIDRWLDERRSDGAIDEASLREAARAAYGTPIRVAIAWSFAWALFAPAVAAALHPLPGAPDRSALGALALVSIACAAAALPLAYSLIARLLAPTAGRVSLVAREAGVALPGRSARLGVRLAILAACLAAAPTSWMAAVILAPSTRAHGPGSVATTLFFSLVAIAWAPVCAALLAGILADPLRQIGEAIGRVAIDCCPRRDAAHAIERVPIHGKDELGALAEGVNAMIDRLEDNAARLRAHVAERDRLLEEAARRAAELGAVLDNLAEAVIACDGEGRVQLVNASGMRLLGPEPSWRGAAVSAIAARAGTRHPNGRSLSSHELPLIRALGGEVVTQEALVIDHHETHRDVFVRTNATPIRDDRGAIVGAVAVARDVTELMQLDIAKDQFIKVAAHELKTPVAIMKGYALALTRAATEMPAPRRSMLEAIARGADRINRIVDDLLTISRLLLDDPPLTAARIDLGRLAEGVVAGRPRVALHEPPTGPLVVHADPVRVQQILSRLVDNAIKYSPDGGDVDVTLAEDPSHHEARASVRDHGIGIPGPQQARIFQLFFRAHTDTPYDYGGLGVGLYLARDMVTRQGGRIWFESEEGAGTTFHFTLPLEER